MSINSEREVTNKSFKAKMSEIISILSGETYTPTPAANDSETLNCKTFEYFMNVLKENIGGGGADNDFLIVGTVDGEGNVTSETSISDILAADTAGKNIKLRLVTTGGDKTDIGYGQILGIIDSNGSEPDAVFLSYINNLMLIECSPYGWAAMLAV